MPAVAHAGQSTLQADTYVTTARPSTNYGALTNLYVNSSSTALLRFDLSGVPSGTAGAQIGRAILRVFVNRLNNPGTLAVMPVTGAAWDEAAVTQQTLPVLGAVVDVEAATDENQFVAFDVTALVRRWADASASNLGFALTTTGADVVLDSKENDSTAHAATLDLTLVAGSGSGGGTAGATGATGATGPGGPAGPTGPTGAAGLQGASGAQGLQGLQGPTGATGAKGDAGGLVYRGAYAAGTAYSLQDVVSYGGAAWVSLAAGNVGVTPGSTNAAGALPWGVLVPAATSTTGSTGTGTGSGTPGLSYQGVYAAGANYGLNAVVTYANAAWVSVGAGNVGNQPGSSPAFWAVLVPAASASATPVVTKNLAFQGAYASATNYAVNDVVTWQSAAWISLHDSNHGNTPDQSALDWAVLVPAAGSATAPVVTKNLAFQGEYASTTNYAINDVVTRLGAAWISIIASNHGNTPDQSPYAWSVLVPAGTPGAVGPAGATGATGLQGPQGERGYMGLTGATGDRGAVGATGRPGFVYQGAYASTTNYAAGDVVLWQGSSYSSLHDTNYGNTPSDSPLDWGLLTSTGPTGPVGATGAQGVQGIQGVPGEFGPAGQQGPVGAQGSPGPQGAAGRDGAQGPQGDIGPVGATGAPGPVGITFRGAYASTTNYAQNDAVVWQNQTWLSLVAHNVGQTPDRSPVYWTLLAAQGGTGPQGPIGLTGPQGFTGATGAAGPQGVQGLTGATGPQGEAGSTFRGGYDSTQNYALHDAVSFGGGTWLSLTVANHGNTPGTTADWAQMAAPGAAGPQGIAGATGAVGPQGAAGLQGAQGVAGPVGATGVQGPPAVFRGGWNAGSAYVAGDAVAYNGSSYVATSAISGTPPGFAAQWSLLAAAGSAGATGATGAQGSAGPQGVSGPQGAVGATGPAGLNWLGAYSSVTNYGLRDAVVYGGSSYVSVAANNVGQTPGASGSTGWALLAAAGAAGAQGVAGSNGAAGVAASVSVSAVNTGAPGSPATVQNVGTGTAAQLVFTIPQGQPGINGADGSPGLVYRGTWAGGTAYAVNDVAYFNGTSYVSRVAGNIANPASDVANGNGNWAIVAAAGVAGAPGAATVSIGTVTAGTTASVTNSGTQSAAMLNFVLPRGATGPAGLTWRAAWDTGTQYSTGDAVSYGGSAYVAIANSQGTLPVGSSYSSAAWQLLAAQGAVGPGGPVGVTPVFTINPTVTGQPGTAAGVVQGGTAANPTLTFTIPQGATGAQGPAGTGGTDGGGAFFSTVHTVAAPGGGFGSAYYAVGSTASATTEAAPVLTLMPASCSVASVSLYNTASSAATVVLRSSNGTTGLGTVASCQAAAGGSVCTLGSAVDLSGKLVDLSITSTATASSYVFTAFSCR